MLEAEGRISGGREHGSCHQRAPSLMGTQMHMKGVGSGQRQKERPVTSLFHTLQWPPFTLPVKSDSPLWPSRYTLQPLQPLPPGALCLGQRSRRLRALPQDPSWLLPRSCPWLLRSCPWLLPLAPARALPCCSLSWSCSAQHSQLTHFFPVFSPASASAVIPFPASLCQTSPFVLPTPSLSLFPASLFFTALHSQPLYYLLVKCSIACCPHWKVSSCSAGTAPCLPPSPIAGGIVWHTGGLDEY